MRTLWQISLFSIISAPALAAECVDFSGKWSGQCIVTVESQEGREVFSVDRDLHVVQNGCDKISINGGIYFYTIGGNHNATDSGANFTHTYTKLIDWNDDKTVILETELIGGRKFANPSTEVYSGVEHNTFRLQDGAFHVTKDERLSVRNLVTLQRGEVRTIKDCRLAQQPEK